MASNTATITVSLLDTKDYPPEAIEQWRMNVEAVLNGEAGRRLLRQLQGVVPPEIRWSLVQSPRPRGTTQATPKELAEAQRQRQREWENYLAARRDLRTQSLEAREAAIQRLRDKGFPNPTLVQLSDELRSAPRPVSDTAGRRGDPLGTDAAVKRVLKKTTINEE
jgi:hypothetical protein